MMNTDQITTEDGVKLRSGDHAYNYYDMKPGTIREISKWAQPNTRKGQSSATPLEEWDNFWFDFEHDDGTVTSLDGSRICSDAYAARRGWK